MALIDPELMLSNERILFETRQRYWIPKRIIGAIVSLFFGLFGTIGFFSGPGKEGSTLSLIIFLILALTWIPGRIRWKNTVYALTDRRLLQQSGILSKKLTHCPIDKIQNVDLKTSFVTGLGTVAFDTAGGPLREIVWVHLGNPKEIYRKVCEYIDEIRTRGTSTMPLRKESRS